MKLFFIYTILYIFIILSSDIKADIPVHCVKSQIAGKWNFKATKPIKKTLSELYKLRCGHQMPSNELTAYQFNMSPNEFVEHFSIHLKDSDEAIYFRDKTTDQDLKGSWTMIYDEGFDIKFNQKNKMKNDRSYFLFSRYGINFHHDESIKSKWVSNCYSSLIGWYYIGDSWGCLYGVKEGVNKDEVTNGEAENKLIVLEGKITSKDGEDVSVNVNVPPTNNMIFVETKGKEIVEVDVTESLNENINKERTTFLEAKIGNKLELQSAFKSSLESNMELLSTSTSEFGIGLGFKLTSTFKDHSKYVKKLNSMNFLWKAESYEQFEGMTLSQLNKFAGRRKVNRMKEKSKHNQAKQSVASKLKIPTKIKNKKLPKSFSLVDFMSKPRSQGDCGSCFAVATLGMLEARIRRNYPGIITKYFSSKDDFALSLKHSLNCSVYNQGCDGGYAYLVMKFFNEFEMRFKKCFSKGKGCNSEKNCSDKRLEKFNLSVRDYKYLGGSYGRCTEELLLNELYTNGPVIVSLEPDYSFMFYRSGIYRSPNNNWKTTKQQRPEWEKVDHSMVLVGWGEEIVKGKTVKYWILQNSWGSHWGEDGFMKFIRGTDHLGIESICESAIPVVQEE